MDGTSRSGRRGRSRFLPVRRKLLEVEVLEIRQRGLHSRAKKPSSSSLLLGAGNGAPGPSVVGSWTYPSPPNGLSDLMDDSRPLCCDVSMGASSRRDQPREFMESRNDDDAMVGICVWV